MYVKVLFSFSGGFMRLRTSLPVCPWYLGLPCAVSGLFLLCMTVAGSYSLASGSFAALTSVGVILFLLAALAVVLLQWENCPTMTTLFLILPIAAALYLRLLCLDHQTHDYHTFLAQWVAYFRENGGFSAIQNPIGDYNVPYLYFLAAISYLQIPDLYLIKLFSVLFDILLAWAGLRLSRNICQQGSCAPLICFTALLFLPTVVLNGAYWGQCDSLYVSLILLAFSSVLDERPKTSVILLSIAFSFKLQTIFLIPLWCVFWYSKRIKFRHLLLFPVGYLATILPALALGKPLADILNIYLGQTSEYSGYLTMNAPSVFAFLPYGFQPETDLASKLGIAAAFLLVFILLALLFWKRRKINPSLLLTTATVLAIGIPFLLPSMHERYFFLADILSLVWACSDRRYIPIAVLVEVSSLSSYSTYLNLQYTLPLYINGRYYVMAFEAVLMLAALIWSLIAFGKQLKALH